jgi:hypothetical protein
MLPVLLLICEAFVRLMECIPYRFGSSPMLETHLSTILPYCLVDMGGFARTATGYPGTNGGSRLLCDLELYRPPRLPLDNHCSVANYAGKRNVADRDGD